MSDINLINSEETIRGYYRGRIGLEEWKVNLLDCVYYRKFRLATKILQHILMDIGVSQCDWIWRVILIVLANVETSDQVFQRFYRMIMFTKSLDYNQRRYCIFFAMVKMGRVHLAKEFLEKDMPKKLLGGPKSTRDILMTNYEKRCRAVLQMTRALSAFWNTSDTNGESEILAQFDLSKLENQLGASNPMELDKEVEVDIAEEQTLINKNQKRPRKITKYKTLVQHDLETTAGWDVINKPGLSNLVTYYDALMSSHGRMDPFLKHYIEILKKARKMEKLEEVLFNYRNRNRNHPTAQKILLDHYLEFHSEDVAQRLPILQEMCESVPYGLHVAQYCSDLMSQGVTDHLVLSKLVVTGLMYENHKMDSTLWQALASLLRNLSGSKSNAVIGFFKETYLDIESWWGYYHFSPITQAELEESGVVLPKIEVCYVFFGADHGYIKTASEVLGKKRRKKFQKHLPALNVARILIVGKTKAKITAKKQTSHQSDTKRRKFD